MNVNEDNGQPGLVVYTKNSMNYWYPRIKDLGVPMPETLFALHKKSSFDWYSCLDGVPLPQEDIDALKACADRIGYPLFMRSDLVSGKHDYVDTCFVKQEADLIPNLVGVVEGNALCDQPMTSIVLRKYLHLVYGFKAFRGLPIAPERRYFVVGGEVACRHPYWPVDAIHGKGLPENWRNILREMNAETSEEVELLSGYASTIGKALGGAWSVDFALAYTEDCEAKRWYMIDAALAADSYHDPECPIRSRFVGSCYG